MLLFCFRITFFSLFLSVAHAQTDSLGKANERESASAVSVLYTLGDFLYSYASNKPEEECKQIALKLIREGLYSSNMTIPNDLEGEKEQVQLIEYGKKLRTLSAGKWEVKLSNFKLNQLAFDKLRRKHFLIVKADKITSFESIEAETGDTLIEEKIQPLVFYFRFDRLNNISSNFKIFGIVKPGQAFKLEPLAEEVEWWLALPEPWKAFFRRTYKLPEFPAEVELIHLLNRSSVSLEGATFLNDASPLNRFKKLHSLNLRKSNFSDFKQLKDLRYLHELFLEGSKVTSFEGLDSMLYLRKLTASKLGIVSLEPLRKVPNLEELDLSENMIEDISALQNHTKLQKLNLSMNDKIRNAQPLARMRVMQELSLAKIDIKDLSILKDMIFMDKLNIFNTGITTLEPLRQLVKITSLNVGYNLVTSLDPIKGMFFLQHLNIGGTAVADISVLGNFKFLKTLDCANNPKLTTLGPVIKLEDIQELKCFYTKIDKNEVQQFKKRHLRCRITFY